MKVAIVEPPLIGHQHRGIGVYTRHLLQGLKAYTEAEVIEVEYSSLPSEVDLYHFPYFDPFFLTLPWMRSKKTVLTIHDLIPLKFPKEFPRGMRGEIKWQIQKYLARHVDEIITDSNASKKDIVDILGIDAAKVYPIYLAPDPLFLNVRSTSEKAIVAKKYDLPSRFALFVGETNWNKNIQHCIRAASIAKVPLLIVSKSFSRSDQLKNHPWHRSLHEAKKAISVSSLVIALDNVDTHELSVLYQLADILLMPSYYEGFGLPIVEAFASGCPVITSHRGSLGEVAGDAAQIVNPEDVNDIARAISEVWTTKKLATNLSQKGKLQVKKFSWQFTAQETYNVYKKCIES